METGVFRDNNYPQVDGKLDFEQEKRLQARQATEFARGDRPEQVPFASKGPDATRAEAEAAQA